MNFLVVFATLMSVAASYPVVQPWTLDDLSYVISSNTGDASMRPYYIDALNTIMYALYTGKDQETLGMMVSPSGNSKWTEDELVQAVMDPNITSEKKAYFLRSLQDLRYRNEEKNTTSIEVPVPAMDISTWPVDEIKEALDDPTTKPALLPYLEKAKEDIKKAAEAGTPLKHVVTVTPVGLVPLKSDYKPTIIPRIIENIAD